MFNKKTLLLLGVFSILAVTSLLAGAINAPAPESSSTSAKEIIITPEMEKQFPSKDHHAKLSLACIACHDGQGADPQEFTTPGDEGCLSCHKSKEYLAERLKFMDRLHVNPHNSIHDGPTLYCDECHYEHQPSVNMCSDCHEKEIETNIWMRKTP